MNKAIVFSVLALLAFGIIAFAFSLQSESADFDFEGRITNMQVKAGKFSGTAEYDKSCIMLDNGMTRCDAGIRTQEFGLLNFNYTHNMQAKPCIAPGNKIVIEILNEKGDARVQRF